MTSLLSILHMRTGNTTTAGQLHWLKGVEKSDRRGFEAGQDSEATENDCPYKKRPYRDCWIEAFRRARGIEDAAKAVNEFGVPTDVWSTMSEVERNRFWRKRWYHGRMKRDPLLFAKHKDRQATTRVRIRERWAEDPEFFRAKMREQYWKDVEATRAKAREKYQRNIDREQARGRRRNKAHKAQRTINRSPDQVYMLINRAVSKALPDHVRDDVVSSMCLAVLEGKLFIEDIEKDAKRFLAAYNREFDHFKTTSLDEPINGQDGRTYLDLLADPENEDEAEQLL
ncbi:UNVERIFIED_ORG: hypothetical protein LHK14_01140 [Roseateles sp. XES5]|nr:hypothetical protein [Roseateles sp. XES5]